MRLFTAIDLSDEVRGNLDKLVRELRSSAQISWVSMENVHLTTKFIGEWDAGRLGEILSALRQMRKPAPFNVAVRGLGWYPNPHQPRVFWAGVAAPEGLRQLVQDTELCLAAVGTPREDRAFSPHLTLARVKGPHPLGPLRRAVASLESTDFGEFAADRFVLYQSFLRPGGSVYEVVETFPLS
jgi:2'-5' RNA ligase